jgi:hypothetical protein
MLLPWTDWQFWLVTAIAAWGGWNVFRQLLPRPSSTACGSCATGTAACAKHAALSRLSRQGERTRTALPVLASERDPR